MTLVIKMEGPPASGKTAITNIIRKWTEQKGKTVYVEEENMVIYGLEDNADIKIYTKQTL